LESAEPKVDFQRAETNDFDKSLTDSTPFDLDENIPLKKRLLEKKLLDRLRIKDGGFIN